MLPSDGVSVCSRNHCWSNDAPEQDTRDTAQNSSENHFVHLSSVEILFNGWEFTGKSSSRILHPWQGPYQVVFPQAMVFATPGGLEHRYIAENQSGKIAQSK
jgi:hypothetical protein